MQKTTPFLLSGFLLLTACGGGGGGDGGTPSVSTQASSQPSAVATTITQPSKPVVDYMPLYLSLAASSYNVICGPVDKPRTPAVVKIAADGALTPWPGGALNLYKINNNFTRTLNEKSMDGSFYGVIGGFGPSATWGITSDGGIAGGNLPLTDVANNPLGGGDKNAGIYLQCDGATEAAALANKSAYTAFAKYIDAQKTTLNCIRPNSAQTLSETYEINGGELKFKGKAISLMTGIKRESIGDSSVLSETNAAGVVVYRRNIVYSLTKVDGTELGLIFNEYGEFAALTYKFADEQQTCFKPV
jgi:hypothetical protein